MFNNLLYNTSTYCIPINLKKYNWSQWDFNLISFNGYDFSDIIISNIPDDYAWINFELKTYELSDHGQWIWNRFIKNKSITIKGKIIAENQESLEEKITKIKSKILQWKSVLYLKRKSKIIKSIAIVTSFSLFKETWTINSIPIEIVFSILDPFFYSLQKNELAYYWNTWNFYTSIYYESWTHPAKPLIFVMFWNTSTCNEISIKIGEKEVMIHEEFSSWDILLLDWENIDIAKNWEYWINWEGEIGKFNIWENNIEIKFNTEVRTSLFIQYSDTYV